MSLSVRGCLALVVALVAFASGAGAQPLDQPPTAARTMQPEARAHLDEGLRLYAAGSFDAALAEFEAGQRIDPHPDFLYAIAQSYRMKGLCRDAVDAYRAFLAAAPPEAEAWRARENIRRCEADMARAERRVPAAPVAAQPASLALTSQPDPWYTDWPGNVLVASGIVSVGVGAALLLAASGSVDDANRADQYADHEALADRARWQRWVGVGAAATGAILVGVGVARYLWWRPQRVTATVSLERDGGMVGVAARY